MHVLQPKQTKLKVDESEKLLSELNISLSQLPKVKINDPSLENMNCEIGDVIKVERVSDGKKNSYFRVVSI